MRDVNGRFVKGHGFTDEMLTKMSEAKIGKVTWNTGRPASEATRNRLREMRKGKEPWNKGKVGVMPEPWNKGTHIKTNDNPKLGGIKECGVCGKEFYVQQNRINSGRGKFCSKKCSYEGRELKMTFQPGEKHPMYIDGKAGTGYPSIFNPALKKRIKERDNYTCQLCGVTERETKERYGRSLCVNHIDFVKTNCNESNLNTLCTGCNSKINHNRGYYTNLFQSKIKKTA